MEEKKIEENARQKTIKSSVSYTGFGLHSGKPSTVIFKPAPSGSGVVFVRTDLPGNPQIPAKADYVTATVRATTLTAGDVSIFTVEHLLAALFITDIDNCIIEMDGPEPPVADGSALPYVELLQNAGTDEQDMPRDICRLDKSFSIHDGDRYVLVVPYDGQRFSFLSINDHPLLGSQYIDALIGETDLARDIAPARTIAFMHEIEGLQKMGLGLGGSPENVIIYDKDKVLTPLRFEDELVRHKVLDIMGDLFLAGRFYGHVIAVKSAHALNTALAVKIAKYKEERERS